MSYFGVKTKKIMHTNIKVFGSHKRKSMALEIIILESRLFSLFRTGACVRISENGWLRSRFQSPRASFEITGHNRRL